MRGNHHDGWNHGAADPISGLVALMAEAKALGELAAEGYRLDRTVIYAAWDAEEPGPIGSTEWVEDNAEALREHLVAYLNTDGNSRGFVSIGGSHSLQHLGIASLNSSFSEEGPSGSYHTLYDTYAHYARFRDPGFRYGAALSKLNGRATLRLAQAALLPMEFEGVADAVERFLTDLEAATERQRMKQQRQAEALLTDTAGLPRRPWFRIRFMHPVFTPAMA